jgi:hypothetical protein
VIETVDNAHQKAGAIDQVLDDLLPRLSDSDAVLVMDADKSLSPGFRSAAARRLRYPEADGARVGGVGGIFFGCFPVAGLIGHLQDNEYVRYAREIGRRGDGRTSSPAPRHCFRFGRCATSSAPAPAASSRRERASMTSRR